jgi:hypothetical protein
VQRKEEKIRWEERLTEAAHDLARKERAKKEAGAAQVGLIRL